MCVVVLYIYFLCAIHLNHAADSSVLRISASTSAQGFTLVEGTALTLLQFYNLTDAAPGLCNGTCVIGYTNTVREKIDDCNVAIQNGIPELNVLIKKVISKSFLGVWKCTLRTPSMSNLGAMSIQSPEFRIFSNNILDPVLTTTPPGSLVSVVVPESETANVTLEAGMQTLELTIKGDFKQNQDYNCVMNCDLITQKPVNSQTCHVYEVNLTVVLQPTPAYEGIWICKVTLRQPTLKPQNDWIKIYKLNISVKKPQDLTKDEIIIIATAVSTVVVLIIIGQTICIIHFKKKARRAEIDKNLTPKNTINEGSTEMRYVKKDSGTTEVDGGIYEALEPVRAQPPPLPPLETLPVIPKRQHLIRSVSQSNLLENAKTTTTPLPSRKQQKAVKFNTVGRSSSLERMKNRPPQPLPIDTDVYEDVNIADNLPFLTTKKSLFGMKLSAPERNRPTGPKRPVNAATLEKPAPSFPSRHELLKPTGSNIGRPPITSQKPPAITKPMGGVPILPSMISAANLKPVKAQQKPPPPVTERPRPSQTPSTSAKPYKPKPPLPLPEPVRKEPEPIPEDFESDVSNSSDDEFECYDVLQPYVIYGNTLTKKS